MSRDFLIMAIALEKKASLMFNGLEKQAASTKVLNKMIEIASSNPSVAKKIGFTGDVLNTYLANKNYPSLMKKEMNKAFKTGYVKTPGDWARDQFSLKNQMGSFKVYDVSDRYKPGIKNEQIGPSTRHIAIDTLSENKPYHPIDHYSKYKQLAGRYMDEAGNVVGYESVAKGGYLSKRETGTFFTEDEYNKILNKPNKKMQSILDVRYPLAGGTKAKKFKNKAQRNEWMKQYEYEKNKISNRDLANAHKVQLEPGRYDIDTIDNLDHNYAYKGVTMDEARKSIADFTNKIEYDPNASYWVSHIPQVSAAYNFDDFAYEPVNYILRTKNKNLINTLSKQNLIR